MEDIAFELKEKSIIRAFGEGNDQVIKYLKKLHLTEDGIQRLAEAVMTRKVSSGVRATIVQILNANSQRLDQEYIERRKPSAE